VDQSARAPIAESDHVQRLLVVPRPPIIAAERPEDMALAARIAERADPKTLSQQPQSGWVTADALPFLAATAAGREFLAAPFPRALARGMPPEICPSAAAAAGPAGASRGEVATRALDACMGDLGSRRDGCGCRVVALDGILTVPREDTVYATGTSARMRSAALGIDLMLVAEDAPGGRTLLRDLSGEIAVVVRDNNSRVVLRFERDGREFSGRSILVGYRRGRIAERIYATDSEGHRLSLLIGFAPGELAEGAAAWLAWPKEG